jgi:hypothetical protein
LTSPERGATVKKRARAVGILYAAFFGAFTAYVIWGDWANRTFAKPLDALCYPVRLLYHLVFGSDDAYLTWYFVLCILYMAGLGFALGFGLYRLVGGSARRARPRA